MKNYVIYAIIVFGVLGIGCGSRKTDTNISKQSSEVRQSETSKTNEKQTEQSKTEKSEEHKNDITDKETVKQTIIEFGSDGKPTKQTTTETQRDRTDKSTNNKKETLTINKTHLIEKVANRDIRQTITIKEKSKKTWANNYGLPALGIVAVLVVLLWLYLKFKK